MSMSMSESSKFIGFYSAGNFTVEVDKDTYGHYSFSAVNDESLPLAVELARLQAVSFRGFSNETERNQWKSVEARLKEMEKEL